MNDMLGEDMLPFLGSEKMGVGHIVVFLLGSVAVGGGKWNGQNYWEGRGNVTLEEASRKCGREWVEMARREPSPATRINFGHF